MARRASHRSSGRAAPAYGGHFGFAKVGLFFALLLNLSACTGVLGDFKVEDTSGPELPDASVNITDGSTKDGAKGDAQAEAPCMPGAKDCKGVALRSCNGSSAWQTESTCPFVCMDGTCAGSCTPDEMRCEADMVKVCSKQGEWNIGHSMQLGLRRARVHGYLQAGRETAMHRNEPSDL